jgi:hypothetical protein
MGTDSILRLGPAVLVAALGLTLSVPARAAGRVLRSGAGSASVAELRLARASSPDWARQWAQYRLDGTGRAAVVTPVAPGTFVDPAPDAWFEALETATAPRVVPPAGAPLCGATSASSVDVTGDLSHAKTLAATQVAVLSELPELLAFASSQGFVVEGADQLALAEHPGPFVALVYELTGSRSLTQPIRYVTRGDAQPIALPLAVSPTAADVTLFTIGAGRARVSGATEHTPDALGFSWHMLLGHSDYVERRRELLAEDGGKSWLVETTGTAPLYQWSVLPNQAGSIPPVVQVYFERSIAQGAATGTAQQCLEPLWDAHKLGKDGAVVADPCPDGALAVVPLASGAAPACSAAPSAGTIDSAMLACGAASDLAHALAGSRPDLARITRSLSVAGSGSEPASIELSAGTPLPRVIAAPAADVTGCLPTGNGAGGSHGGTGGSMGESGSPGGPAPTDPGYDPGSAEADFHTDVSVSCWGSSEPGSGGDSCSGDSSSSSAGDDSCSGDSSSSTEGGDSCSGDSSDSSGSDACAGDSSDGYGSSDSGCSADSGSDSGCSGGDASSGGDCNLSRRRAKRPKLSLWLLISAAIALPLRRRTRKLAAGQRRTH